MAAQTEVYIDGVRYCPVDQAEAEKLSRVLREFSSEATTYWRNLFIEDDSGMYAEGDENAPFFTETFLYNLLGKDEARSVLSIVRRLSVLAGVEFDG